MPKHPRLNNLRTLRQHIYGGRNRVLHRNAVTIGVQETQEEVCRFYSFTQPILIQQSSAAGIQEPCTCVADVGARWMGNDNIPSSGLRMRLTILGEKCAIPVEQWDYIIADVPLRVTARTFLNVAAPRFVAPVSERSTYDLRFLTRNQHIHLSLPFVYISFASAILLIPSVVFGMCLATQL